MVDRDLSFVAGTGVQGWRQFLAAKLDMLYQVDIARKQSCGHIVEAWHGRVAEAVFREWLAQFLPKRFAVTSGYIISQAFTETAPTPHYDVIIYDQLAAPILWVERSPDSSVLGRAVAVPAEHVAAVIEVKSALTPATARDSVRKLREIQPLVLRHDDPDPYHFYLPQHFSCGVVFFHLPRKHEFSAAALNNLLPRDHHLNKYYGGVVLAGEGKDVGLTGRLDLVGGPEVVGRSNVGRHRASLFESYSHSDAVMYESESHSHGIQLMWSTSYFARFAFDIIALLNGKYSSGELSALHGLINEPDLQCDEDSDTEYVESHKRH